MTTRLRKSFAAFIVALLAVCMTVPLALADMQGIDVSGWQSPTVTCTASYDFAIVKATQGTNFINNNMTPQARCVQQRGKGLGFYHYAAGGNPVAEADYFVNTVRPYLRRAVLALDWEGEQNPAFPGNGWWVRTFVNRVHDTTGVWPLVYTSGAYVGYIPADVRRNCGLWVAQYATMAATGYQSAPWLLGHYGEAIRQYTSNGWVSGYGANLDLNLFRGDRAAWDKYANPSGSPAPAPAPSPAPAPAPSTDYEALATAVIRGDYGNDPVRRQRLGASYGPVMAIVNRRLSGGSAPAPAPSTGSLRVTVRSGDTISAIASRYRAFPLTAWRVPSGNINLIYPGQVVTYGGYSAPASPSRSYTVRSGDTLGTIASRLGISYTQLTGYRSGNPNLIYPGEVLHW